MNFSFIIEIFISSFFTYVMMLFLITYLIQFIKQIIARKKQFYFKNKWLDNFTFIFGIMYATIITILALTVWSKM